MISPESYKRVCGELKRIVTEQAAISGQDGLGSKTSIDILHAAELQLSNETLRVLVMGRFNSGKSTMLNALMGETFLPTKPIPTTAAIGEIVYSDTKKAILYPSDGGNPSEIDNVTSDVLSKYIVIDHDNAQQDDTPIKRLYKKIVIKYPLSICKHGVMLVDSPGLDDPTCHDAITQEYLPNADAIIYCLNSTQAFTAGDKREIETLTSAGYKSIIFVLTYYDILQYNDSMNYGSNQAEEAKRHYTRELSRYTDLGASGIFFVSSLHALKGKKEGKRQLLEQSNFILLESRLDEILYNEKGRMKLFKALYEARKANREARQQLNDFIELANADRNTLTAKVQSAQNGLNNARNKATNILMQFNNGTLNIINSTKDRARAFFLSDILPNIDTWVKEFEPADGQEFKIWHPKKSGTIFTESCIKYVQKQIETKMAQWCEKLVKEYIQPELEKLTNQQNANLNDYENDLRAIRTNLNLATNGNEIGGDAGPSKTNRILSAIAGLFLNPASLVAGGMAGGQGLVSSLVATLVGGIIIGVVSMFTPVGLPALIITWVLSAIAGVGFTAGKAESKIKKEISKKLHDELSKQQETVANNTGNSVSKVIAKITKAVEDELFAPVLQYEKIVSEAQQNANSGSTALQARINKYRELRSRNDRLASDMDNFAQSIGA